MQTGTEVPILSFQRPHRTAITCWAAGAPGHHALEPAANSRVRPAALRGARGWRVCRPAPRTERAPAPCPASGAGEDPAPGRILDFFPLGSGPARGPGPSEDNR